MAASTASFVGGYLCDKISRKRTIALGAILFCIGAALEAASTNLVMFIFGRVTAGGSSRLSSTLYPLNSYISFLSRSTKLEKGYFFPQLEVRRILLLSCNVNSLFINIIQSI